uniref:Uncharacterized protein n=1 Tax=Eutreptiella gymnastica TaxID=73025 RepID=A0A7S4D010_9EUGL
MPRQNKTQRMVLKSGLGLGKGKVGVYKEGDETKSHQALSFSAGCAVLLLRIRNTPAPVRFIASIKRGPGCGVVDAGCAAWPANGPLEATSALQERQDGVCCRMP